MPVVDNDVSFTVFLNCGNVLLSYCLHGKFKILLII